MTESSATNVPPSLPTLTSPPATKTAPVATPPSGMARKLLQITAFFMAFATVMIILLLYMDTTAIRHHQFKMNMTQDYDMLNVAQDDPELVTYIREVHIRPAVDPHHYHMFNMSSYLQPSAKTNYIAKLLKNKKNGIYIESGAYKYNRPSDTEWLERNLSWSGLLIQSDPRDYFNLLKHGRGRSQSIHACLSPTCYPKEITFHQDERDGVKINSVHANSLIDDDWFNTRVKCFPLFSLMLAINCTTIDYLSLDADGMELQVIDTLPLDRIKIQLIDVHLQPNDDDDDADENDRELLEDTLKRLMAIKTYQSIQKFNNSYLFMQDEYMKTKN